jgi:2-C-methyl-D-erythritol 2,4-cyclodiphosphate synthase
MNNELNYRIGIGYDVHAFASNRRLILGGIEIPFEKGLAGHSDSDVVLHAITDALLGSLALGDIGQHFPDTDQQFKNYDSSIFLSKANELVKDNGYQISNIDATVTLEKPKLASYISKMRNKIAEILEININQVSVKATTNEKLGFVGREEGIAAIATVLIAKLK